MNGSSSDEYTSKLIRKAYRRGGDPSDRVAFLPLHVYETIIFMETPYRVGYA